MVAPQDGKQFSRGCRVAPGAVMGLVVDSEELTEGAEAVPVGAFEPFAGHPHRAEPAGVVVQSSRFESGLQMPQVEGDVVGDEDGIAQKGVQVGRQLPEFRGVRHHRVVDSGETGDAGGNRPGRPDEPHPPVEFPPAIVKDGRHLGDVVSRGGAAIGLDVDDGKGGGAGRGHGSKDGMGSAMDVRC